MIVGIPKEIKDHENRVAMPPGGCQALVAAGHKVVVEKGAGHGTGLGDAEYEAVGAVLAEGHGDVFRTAELVIKVKEPLASEYDLLREDSILFTFLHLAAFPDLASVLLEKRVTAIAYETIQLSDGSMPILTPMSEVAGRLAAPVAAYYLEKLDGGGGGAPGGGGRVCAPAAFSWRWLLPRVGFSRPASPPATATQCTRWTAWSTTA